MLHSLTAKRTSPFQSSSSGSLTAGLAILTVQPADSGEGGGRSRSLVEEQPGSRLSALATAAVGAVAGLAGSRPPSPPPPPTPVPAEWVEGGTLGQWPKPYRNKTRQVPPNSIYEWKCGQEAANFSLSAVTHSPLLQSTEWRHRYGDDVSLFKWCRQGLPEEVPQLQQVLKLESSKPRPERGLTVVTQLSLERFQMLENQCSTWPLQISAVLYIPLLHGRIFSAEEPYWNKKSLDVGVAESLKFWRSMEASSSACILDLEVVVEERCERYAAMLYPANAARNRALVNTKTDAVLLVDVDFAVSLSLARIVQEEASYERLMSMLNSRNAVVLPAFETQDDGEAGRKVALEAVRQGKPYVVNKFQWNVVFGFHVPQYPQGHQATDYWRWIKSHAAYPVQYQIGYEPYIMMHRAFTPFYDERFRGYYWNKVQHLMHISLQNGFNFLVHPTAFVVHVPHKKPSTKWLTRKMGQKEKNHMLFDNALFHMRQMDFVPVTSFPELCNPMVAPVLPGENEMRQIALTKAEAEKAAADAAAGMAVENTEAVEAAAAKRQTEVEEAEQWRAENAEAAAAADMQHQDAAIVEEQAQIAAAAQTKAAAAVVAQQQAVARAQAASRAQAQAQAAEAEVEAAKEEEEAAAEGQQAAARAAEQQQQAAAAVQPEQQVVAATVAAQQQASALPEQPEQQQQVAAVQPEQQQPDNAVQQLHPAGSTQQAQLGAADATSASATAAGSAELAAALSEAAAGGEEGVAEAWSQLGGVEAQAGAVYAAQASAADAAEASGADVAQEDAAEAGAADASRAGAAEQAAVESGTGGTGEEWWEADSSAGLPATRGDVGGAGEQGVVGEEEGLAGPHLAMEQLGQEGSAIERRRRG